MAAIMTKRGSQDNIITYEFMCESAEDMASIDRKYITLGSICIVVNDGAMDIYIADSAHEWHSLSIGASGGSEDAGASLSIHVCANNEVSNGLPNISEPDENTIYLVASGNTSGNLYEEYIYVDSAWEKFGAASIDLSGYAPIVHPEFTGSISMGRKANTTVGIPSIAIGSNVTASNNYAVAEGDNSTASGNASHAEGGYTNATGTYSHAEGYHATAVGSCAHAEGYYTSANDTTAHAEGYQTKAVGTAAHAEGQGNSLTSRQANNQTYTGTGAHGAAAHAEGNLTFAIGDYSHAEGSNTAATSSCAHAEGSGTQALASCAHAEGYNTSASANYAHAEGYETVASGSSGAHAEGDQTEASGTGSHAEGYDTTVSGNYSHVEGYYASVSGYLGSHAEGYYTVASGNTGAHAEGGDTEASGWASHAEGESTIAAGGASHAEGAYTYANGEYSHAEGNATCTFADYSHTAGTGTFANGVDANIFGSYNIIDTQGDNESEYSNWQSQTSYSVGDKVKLYTSSIGTNDNACYNYYICETAHTSTDVFDKYKFNMVHTKHIEIVGNGTDNNSRSNARALDWNGNEYLKGNLYVNCNADSTGGTQVAPIDSPNFTNCIRLGNFQPTIGTNSIAVGGGALASGDQAIAFGDGCRATQMGAVAMGTAARAEGQVAASFGTGATASGYGSFAEGVGGSASGLAAHKEGEGCNATAEAAHAEGVGSRANGFASHAEGGGTTANGQYSHVGGCKNVADSYTNWTEWVANTSYSVGDKVKVTTTENNITTVKGYICKTANSDASFTASNWDVDSAMNYVEIIGNGLAVNTYSNARALDWDGNEYLKGDLYVGCNADSTGGAKVATESFVTTRVPAPPVADGTYNLQVVVSSGTATYSWVAAPGSASGVSF